MIREEQLPKMKNRRKIIKMIKNTDLQYYQIRGILLVIKIKIKIIYLKLLLYQKQIKILIIKKKGKVLRINFTMICIKKILNLKIILKDILIYQILILLFKNKEVILLVLIKNINLILNQNTLTQIDNQIHNILKINPVKIKIKIIFNNKQSQILS